MKEAKKLKQRAELMVSLALLPFGRMCSDKLSVVCHLTEQRGWGGEGGGRANIGHSVSGINGVLRNKG